MATQRARPMNMGHAVNSARTQLFHIIARLRSDPDSPSLLKTKRDILAELTELGDDADAIVAKFEHALSGRGGKSAARRGRRGK